MSYQSEKYKIRSGTNDSGKEYEFKIAALLTLRLISLKMEDFWIAMNVSEVGAMDDVVLTIKRPGGTPESYLFQLKHKDNLTGVRENELLSEGSGDFSIMKYSRTIAELAALKATIRTKSGIVDTLATHDDMHFILFTNRPVLDCEFLEEDGDTTWSFFNTGGVVHKLDPTNLKLAARDCSKNFRLFTGQISEKHLDGKIVEEVLNLCHVFGITLSNVKVVCDNYVKFITDWSKGRLGGHYTITQQMLTRKLTEIMIYQHEAPLDKDKERLSSYRCPKKLLWNEILNKQSLTVVDFDGTVMRFLREYVVSEVHKRIKNLDEVCLTWTGGLSTQMQSTFYQENPSLRADMLKRVGNFGKITPLDIYQCLCRAKEMSMLLEIHNLEDYQNVLNILNLSNFCYRVVLINKTQGALPIHQNKVQAFYSLDDLNEENRGAVLGDNVVLQGRPTVALSELLDEDMLKYVRCSDIIRILCGTFSIGDNLNPVPEYYIARSVRKVFVKLEALQLSDELFIVGNYTGQLAKQGSICSLDDVDLNNLDQHHIITTKDLGIRNRLATRKSTHYLVFHDEGNVEWKGSLGCTSRIRPFMYHLDDEFEDDVGGYYDNDINIIMDVPGMGKSTFMDYIAQMAPPNKWILRVNLNDHREYYDGLVDYNAWELLKHFNHLQSATELARLVFKKLFCSRDLIVIFDGFDEVSVIYKNNVTNIVKSVRQCGHPIWLTSRPVMEEHLLEEFNGHSLSLKPFSLYDQKQFLAKYFQMNNAELTCDPEGLLLQFVDELLEAARLNLKDSEFPGVPLQTKLLADVFSEDCKRYVGSKGRSIFEKKFDLLYLYEQFIRQKDKIFCDKFGAGAMDYHRKYKEHQKLLSLKYLFPLNRHIDNDPTKVMDDYYREQSDELQLLQKDGIMMVNKDLGIRCVHRTFAEVLGAKWLYENLHNDKQREAVQFLLRERFYYLIETFFFNILDRLVAKDCPLHLAILNKQRDEAKVAIQSDPSKVVSVDACGRSVLHVMGLRGVVFPERYDPDFVAKGEFNKDTMLELVKLVPNSVIAGMGVDLMGYGPLDYALTNRCFALADAICTKSDLLFALCYLMLPPKEDSLLYCVELGYCQLFKVLLLNFALRDVLLKNVTVDVTVKAYVEDIILEIPTVINDVCEITILELLKNAGHNSTGLHYQIVLKSEEEMLELLNGREDVDKCDYDYYSLLHYSILHGKLKLVQALVAFGANVNRRGGSNNDTPLHLAALEHNRLLSVERRMADERFLEITETLLGNGADANKPNAFGETPLHYILRKMETQRKVFVKSDHKREAIVVGCGPIDTVHCPKPSVLHDKSKCDLARLLISQGTNCNLENDFGETPLHSAAASGYTDIVELLLSKGAVVNERNKNGSTALFVAHDLETAAFLLANGADVKLADNDGRTALHWAALGGKGDVVSTLLLNEANVDKQDAAGNTPFHVARTADLISLLISKEANLLVENKKGENALHTATATGNCDVVDCLLSKGFDIDKQNAEGNTPLHLGVIKFRRSMYCYQIVIELLVRKGANLDVRNHKGKSARDYMEGSLLEDFSPYIKNILRS